MTDDWWRSNRPMAVGMAIWDDLPSRGGPGHFVEAKSRALPCKRCSATRGARAARKVLRVFEDPTGNVWLWTPAEKGEVNDPDLPDFGDGHREFVPPQAHPYVTGVLGFGFCRDCGHHQQFHVLPGGVIDVSPDPVVATDFQVAPDD